MDFQTFFDLFHYPHFLGKRKLAIHSYFLVCHSKSFSPAIREIVLLLTNLIRLSTINFRMTLIHTLDSKITKMLNGLSFKACLILQMGRNENIENYVMYTSLNLSLTIFRHLFASNICWINCHIYKYRRLIFCLIFHPSRNRTGCRLRIFELSQDLLDSFLSLKYWESIWKQIIAFRDR